MDDPSHEMDESGEEGGFDITIHVADDGSLEVNDQPVKNLAAAIDMVKQMVASGGQPPEDEDAAFQEGLGEAQ